MRPIGRRVPESPRSGDRRRAVTLAELLVVASLVAMVAVIVLPMAIDQSDPQLDRAASRLAADILYVQSQAIHTRTVRALVFDVKRGYYTFPSIDKPSVPESDPISKKDFRVLFRSAYQSPSLRSQSHTEEFPEIDLVSANFDSDTALYFDCLGLPVGSDGSSLSSASIWISAGSRSREIVVDVTTGKATVN